MGWYYEEKSKEVTVREWLTRSINGNRYEVLDVAVVKLRTLYAAVKDKESGQVWAAVYLLDLKGSGIFNFGYKPMDETMGPYESECPKRIMKLLTPTSSQSAMEWRERCLANIRAKKDRPVLSDGCKVKFNKPIEFTNGQILDEFHVCKIRKKMIFIHGGELYAIDRWRSLSFQIVS